jgi:chromosome segregation ATPase
VVATKEALDKEFKRLVNEVSEIEKKIGEFDELEKKTNNTKAKELIKGQKEVFKNRHAALKNTREALGLNITAAEVGERDAKQAVAEASDLIKRAKGEKANAQQEVKELSKLLAQNQRGFVTPMVKVV